jgi:putative flippase GtrA
MPLLRQFLSFAVVGVVGFFVDAGVLLLVVNLLGFNVYAGRLLSFAAAATVTWALNARFTFKDTETRSGVGQWLRFICVNAGGALLNFGAYAWMVTNVRFAHQHLPLAVACGSLAGLAVNFTLSRALVFKRSQTTAVTEA